jgi:protoporphyrinogen oxidase
MSNTLNKKTIIILGAGPAGLTCGLTLAKQGHDVIIYEAEDKYVGGLSKTVEFNGYRFDIGGHRFYTKEKEVELFWKNILTTQMQTKKRTSRIRYKNIYLDYPLNPWELILKINPIESFMFIQSFVKTKLYRPNKIETFEDWAISNFGNALYQSFFKSYTEKVWGLECSKISSDWAAQRINNLNLLSLFKNLILSFSKNKNSKIKSLIEEFDYPELGPGQLWEKVRDLILEQNGKIYLGEKVEKINFTSNQKWQIQTIKNHTSIEADEIINSTPLHLFINSINPRPPEHLLMSLAKFKYRSFVTVAIMFKGSNPFKDNWIYVHNSSVRVGRIQNYQNWSKKMTPGSEFICLGLEYFCQKEDDLWNKSEIELFDLALNELKILGINYSNNELNCKIIKSEYAYPIYDLEYSKRLKEIQNYLNQFQNLHTVGRCGLHRYNNQDHSIKTAFLVCKNIEIGYKKFNPWQVNQDAEYIES